MGGKYPGKRKYLFFYYSCFLVVLLLLAGCAVTSQLIDRGQANVYLMAAEKYLLAGDYSAAIKKDQQVLEVSQKSYPGDKALFHMGLIFAHPDNPQKSNTKSLQYFKTLIRDFPESKLILRASIWSATLTALLDMDVKVKKQQKESGILRQKIEENDKTIGILKEQLTKIKEIDIIMEEGKRQGLTE